MSDDWDDFTNCTKDCLKRYRGELGEIRDGKLTSQEAAEMCWWSFALGAITGAVTTAAVLGACGVIPG